MDSEKIWDNCLKDVTGYISPQHFSTWFSPIKMIGGDERTLKLEVPNRFFLEWIKDHYLPLIKDILRKHTQDECAIEWKISKNGKSTEVKEQESSGEAEGKGKFVLTPTVQTPGEKKKSAAVKSRKKVSAAHNLCPRYTFDSFVVGKANEFAHAASFAASKNLGSKYNPLFIYGGVGLGKTHLLQAIGNSVINGSENVNVCYYTSERFMNEFINYVSRHKMTDFRKKFRNVDLLLIDDIQFWEGKERTQEEFFHTFNVLYEAHKQVVVTSDKFPKDIDGIEERLRSRFEWGLVADIQPPDIETKIAILNKKAAEEGVQLPGDVAEWLATVSESNVRELEGYLNRIIAVESLTGQEINLAMSKEALKHVRKQKIEKILSIEEIQKTVAKHFNIKISDLKSKRRHRAIALPRQVAMYISRHYGKFSFPEIGSSFGGKDHSTAIHAVKKIETELKKDTELKYNINKIKDNLSIR